MIKALMEYLIPTQQQTVKTEQVHVSISDDKDIVPVHNLYNKQFLSSNYEANDLILPSHQPPQLNNKYGCKNKNNCINLNELY